MSAAYQIRVYDKQQLAYESEELSGVVELGRQNPGEEGPYSLRKEAGRWRLVVARIDQDTVSRKHLLVEPLPDGAFRVTNLRERLPVRLEGVGELQPKASCECALPIVLPLGQKAVRFLEKGASLFEVQSLTESARPPGALARDSSRLPTLAPSPAVEEEALFQWLHAVMGVLQSAAGSSDFFPQAARTAVDLMGLDSCRVLLLEGERWQTQVVKTGAAWSAEAAWRPSQTVLAKVRNEKKTCWQVPRLSGPQGVSLEGVRAVVAAPILNPKEEVIGVLYGDRLVGGAAAALAPITRREALLVELLASGVAAGLARMEQEKAALTARVQFEQFFTPKLSRHLAAHPDLLKEGKEAEVTVLFCDIRGSSRICERLGPALTVRWINDVLEALSSCVQTQEGVLVDYLGDELEAMWGAPDQQPDHAALACRAALQMLEVLPALNERWQTRLQEPIRVGVGIHTGPAFVGNKGSPLKFQYGPLGNSVNLASRVEGASKYLKTRLLLTGSTRSRLDAGFAVRRLAKVRVVNIVEPVDLYELAPPGLPRWERLKAGYEKALEDFEQQRFADAVGVLGALVVEFPGDGPSTVLLSRALSFLHEDPTGFLPVWDLPGK